MHVPLSPGQATVSGPSLPLSHLIAVITRKGHSGSGWLGRGVRFVAVELGTRVDEGRG